MSNLEAPQCPTSGAPSWQLLLLCLILSILPVSSSPSSSISASSSCPYIVDYSGKEDLDFSHPLLFPKLGSLGTGEEFGVSWLRETFGSRPFSVGHEGSFLIAGGRHHDKMFLGRFLNVLSSAISKDEDNDGDKNYRDDHHIHEDSIIFDGTLQKSVCQDVLRASGHEEALNGFIYDEKRGSMGNLCYLSVARGGGGIGLHQHYASILFLLQGRKQWWFKETAPKNAVLSDPVLGHRFLKKLPAETESEDRLYTCVQEPGDVMYVPERWHHGTSNLRSSSGDQITVGVAWQEHDDGLTQSKAAKNKTQRQIMRILKQSTKKKSKEKNTSNGTSVWSLLCDARLILSELDRLQLKIDAKGGISPKKMSKLRRKGKQLFKSAMRLAKRAKLKTKSELDFRPRLLLAEVYSKAGQQQEAAREMIEASIYLQMVNRTEIPRNLLSGLLYHVGKLLRNVNVLDRAVPVFKELFEMSPVDTQMRTMSGVELAATHWLLEQDEDALRALTAVAPELKRAISGRDGGGDGGGSSHIVDYLDSGTVTLAREISGHLNPEILAASIKVEEEDTGMDTDKEDDTVELVEL